MNIRHAEVLNQCVYWNIVRVRGLFVSSIETRVKSLLKSSRGVAKISMSFKINNFPLKSIFLYDDAVH